MKFKIKILSSFLFFSGICLAQVDVTYTNLVWSDEFNTNGVINSTNWFHQTQLPNGGSWYNGEEQHYTNQTTNSFVNNGFLNIVAKKESYTNQGVTKQYTSARLNSKFAFKYGRVDVRAKFPIGSGTWPAIWMLGKNVNEDGGFFDAAFGTVNWPACGEIDIMEHGLFPGENINYVQSTLHTPSSSGGSVNHGGTIASDLANNYHVYSMNWSANEITFLLDNVAYYTYNPADKNPSTWPFDNDQYVLLNIAMGGISGNIPSNYSQSTMFVDYVRVYQNNLSTEGNEFIQFSFKNPVKDFLTISSNFVVDKVEIIDLLGKKIIALKNENEIDVSNISKGIYILKVYSGTDVGTKKMIIN